jgi:hypothetical protein
MVIGAVVTTITLVIGALVLRAWLEARGPVPVTVQHQTYQRPVSQVVLGLSDGDVTVEPGPPGQVVVERQLVGRQKPIVAETWQGTTLHVQAHCPSGGIWPTLFESCSIHYLLWLPPDTAVAAHTDRGDVTVQGSGGDLSLSTDRGDIKLAGTTGTVRAHTSRGDVTVQGSGGDLSLSTDRGDIKLAGTTGTVQAGSAVGSITGSGLRCTAVTARLGSGSAGLSFTTAPRTVETTAGGDIDIAVPSGRYRVDAHTGSGDPVVDVAGASDSPSSITARSAGGAVYIHYTR